MYPRYEEDAYGWAAHTVQLLKEKKMNEVDFDGIIEELEEMGISNKHALISRLSVVISHLLKWQYQPTMRGHSWIYSIREQRKQSRVHIKDNPSLKSKLDDILTDAYGIATAKAAKETALDAKIFPTECPYTFEQIMDEDFYPE